MSACCQPRSALELNAECNCRLIDPARLAAALDADLLLTGLSDEMAHSRPGLFSATAIFVSEQDCAAMREFVAAFEALVSQPLWTQRVLAGAPAIAQCAQGPRGVFAGFDFHLGENGPQLIEINTNAGGYLLNAVLARAQQACCEARPASEIVGLADEALAMFVAEWRLQRGAEPLRTIAIVDVDPVSQYLYPEFRLFAQLFERAGYRTIITDPAQLNYQNGQLLCDAQVIDLVYNRLTDFYLGESLALRAAYEAGAVVVTPNPHAHALYANKRHLALLSDESALRELGASEAQIWTLLAGVPKTEIVCHDNAESLWARRRNLFFKPSGGFGSKAAYRGDKLTRRVWEEILAGDYVAQAFSPPALRRVVHDDVLREFKFDLRAYAYAGHIQLFAARLYAGQTTNFRTPGGGFAPVFVV